jgi:sugar-specific transcriptional regulator TrmB
MENVHLHLKNLGFTDLEAKCLHVLAVSGTQTGYEIAKELGVSRSNVYAALQKLAEKGAVLTSHGEPTVYQSVPIEEIGERIEAELQASIRYVKEHLPKQDTHRSEYFSLEGDPKVIERVRSELRKAKEEAFCDLAPEEAKLLKEDIRLATSLGVRVLVVSTGEAAPLFARRRGESLKAQDGRKFTLLLDRKLAIVGTRGGDEPTLAMLTEHAAMVELLYHQFCSSVVLQELGQDMGAKLEDKYGKHFKKIIQKYIDGKVPEPKRVGEGKMIVPKLDTEHEIADELGVLHTMDEGKSGDGKTSEGKSGEGKSSEGKSNVVKLNEGKRKKKK